MMVSLAITKGELIPEKLPEKLLQFNLNSTKSEFVPKQPSPNTSSEKIFSSTPPISVGIRWNRHAPSPVQDNMATFTPENNLGEPKVRLGLGAHKSGPIDIVVENSSGKKKGSGEWARGVRREGGTSPITSPRSNTPELVPSSPNSERFNMAKMSAKMPQEEPNDEPKKHRIVVKATRQPHRRAEPDHIGVADASDSAHFEFSSKSPSPVPALRTGARRGAKIDVNEDDDVERGEESPPRPLDENDTKVERKREEQPVEVSNLR